MQLTEIRTLLDKLLAYDLDGYDGLAPLNAQKDAIINWGLRQVGLSLYLYGDVTLTLAENDRVISLSDTKFAKEMLSIDSVRIGSNTLRDATRRYGLYTADQFRAWYPNAASATAGVPDAATHLNDSLVFNRPVNAATAGAHTARGRYLPKPLVDSSYLTPLDVPTHLHEIIAYMAAIKWAMPNATVQEQMQRLQMYSGESLPMLTQEFIREYRNVHGREPGVHILRQASAAYKMTENPGGTS